MFRITEITHKMLSGTENFHPCAKARFTYLPHIITVKAPVMYLFALSKLHYHLGLYITLEQLMFIVYLTPCFN